MCFHAGVQVYFRDLTGILKCSKYLKGEILTAQLATPRVPPPLPLPPLEHIAY